MNVVYIVFVMVYWFEDTLSDKIVDVTNFTCGTTFTIEPGGEAVMFRYNNQPFADGESSLPGLYRVDCDITVMQNDSGEICLKSHISKYGKGYFDWALQCISLFDVSFKGKVTDIDFCTNIPTRSFCKETKHAVLTFHQGYAHFDGLFEVGAFGRHKITTTTPEVHVTRITYDNNYTPESTRDYKITSLLQWTLIPVALIVVTCGLCWKCCRCFKGSQADETQSIPNQNASQSAYTTVRPTNPPGRASPAPYTHRTDADRDAVTPMIEDNHGLPSYDEVIAAERSHSFGSNSVPSRARFLQRQISGNNSISADNIINQRLRFNDEYRSNDPRNVSEPRIGVNVDSENERTPPPSYDETIHTLKPIDG